MLKTSAKESWRSRSARDSASLTSYVTVKWVLEGLDLGRGFYLVKIDGCR